MFKICPECKEEYYEDKQNCDKCAAKLLTAEEFETSDLPSSLASYFKKNLWAGVFVCLAWLVFWALGASLFINFYGAPKYSAYWSNEILDVINNFWFTGGFFGGGFICLIKFLTYKRKGAGGWLLGGIAGMVAAVLIFFGGLFILFRDGI